MHTLKIIDMQLIEMRHPGHRGLSARNRGVGRDTRTQG
jgi:hypothetical protein